MVLGIDLFFSLFNNLAIFIALVGVYGYLIVPLKQSPWHKRQIALGLTFGMFAIGCMYAKIPVFEGVIVDQRNAIIALGGVFGGPLAAYLSAAIAGAYRLYLGGQGALAGVVGVTLAATAGLLLSRRHLPFGSAYKAATSALCATLIILPGFLFVKDFKTGLSLLMSMSLPYGCAIFIGIFTVGLLMHRENQKIELEQLLRESEERFQKMFRGHNAVMLLIDPEFEKIVDANDAASEFYGYTKEELISSPMGKLNTLSPEEIREAMSAAKESQRNYFEFKHRLASGEIRDIESYSSPIIINNRPLLFSVIHDTTERNHARKELIKYRDQLQGLVDEQTQELNQAHQELLQKERLATLGKLTATVSHELRNPLGTIQSALFNIETSIEQKSPEQTERSLELADRSIGRCVNIIEELNSYARAKALDLTECSVDDLLQMMTDEYNFPEGIRVELDLSCGVNTCLDKGKIHQVMVNLINNSVDALKEKASEEKQLKISTSSSDDAYEIAIYDNGTGIPEDVKSKIFEPLFSTKGFGVGLGMVIVKTIIEQHQGEIKIDTKEGEWTRVSLTLPTRLTG